MRNADQAFRNDYIIRGCHAHNSGERPQVDKQLRLRLFCP
jgi:hypothetical protein